MIKCLEKCFEYNVSCPNKECRMWIDYEEEHNCLHETLKKHGDLTLRQCAARLGISFVRVKQIESEALRKITNQFQIK